MEITPQGFIRAAADSFSFHVSDVGFIKGTYLPAFLSAS